MSTEPTPEDLAELEAQPAVEASGAVDPDGFDVDDAPAERNPEGLPVIGPVDISQLEMVGFGQARQAIVGVAISAQNIDPDVFAATVELGGRMLARARRAAHAAAVTRRAARRRGRSERGTARVSNRERTPPRAPRGFRCPDCGKHLSVRASGHTPCRPCAQERTTRRRGAVLELRREGLTNQEIGDRLGIRAARVSSIAAEARVLGLDVPPSPVSRRPVVVGPGTEQSDYRLQRAEVLRRADGRCQRCDGAAHDVHHVVAREDGGSDDLSNLRALCEACHHIEHGKRCLTIAPTGGRA